nr:MAG TPA: chitin synthase regulator [Caudoviricetes sp.]
MSGVVILVAVVAVCAFAMGVCLWRSADPRRTEGRAGAGTGGADGRGGGGR